MARAGSDSSEQGPWATELTDLVRAVAGGLLFGVPLLYTMEIWWVGSHTEPRQMAVVLLLLIGPVYMLNHTAGFRAGPDVRVRDAVADTIEAVAIGVVITTVVLVLIRQITPDTPLAVALGTVLYESIPFCIGIGVARHFLAGGRDGGDGDDGTDGSDGGTGRRKDLAGTLADLGATVIGAVFISLSIAPTDEVPMIAAATDPPWLLLLVAATLVTSYAIMFVAGFAGQEQRRTQEGVLQRPITETVVCYLLSLGVAAVLLWAFQRGLEPWTDLLARAVVLALPASIGGAAGRLAV